MAYVSSPGGRATASIIEIDLDALIANWRYLAARAPNADPAAVVKCDAYGLGVARVVHALSAAGCRTYYVAHAFEGADVRRAAGADARIFVMHGPVEGEAGYYAEHGLIPVLNSPEQIEIWRAPAKAAGMALPAVVHVDTGMNRLGLSAKQFLALADARDGFEGLAIDHLMSHLACASSPDEEMNARQLAAFTELRRRMPGAPASFAASAGIYCGPDFGCDIVRLGLALYGASPFDAAGPAEGLKTVVTWRAPVLQTRIAEAGETVGYGATQAFGRPTPLAIVGAGYGDGYRRNLSNIGRGYANGAYMPVAGRVSMDLTAFDMSDLDQPLVPGDFIELLGPHITAEELAQKLDTATYEILTGLGARPVRRYLWSGADSGEIGST